MPFVRVFGNSKMLWKIIGSKALKSAFHFYNVEKFLYAENLLILTQTD